MNVIGRIIHMPITKILPFVTPVHAIPESARITGIIPVYYQKE